jgi:hypothetical protein
MHDPVKGVQSVAFRPAKGRPFAERKATVSTGPCMRPVGKVADSGWAETAYNLEVEGDPMYFVGEATITGSTFGEAHYGSTSGV